MQVATPNSAISSSTTSTPSSIAAAVAAAGGTGPFAPTDSTMTQLILDHPLYPLLQMVFQKCELATSSPRDSQAETICSSDSFSEDIRNFITESRHRNISLTTGHQSVDEFMLKSIEVLRIHLLELEKVHQLCDNFCQRYINCLKGKLPIDLVVDDGSSRDTNSTSRNGQQDGGPSSNNSTSTNNNNNNQNNGNGAPNSTSNTSQNGQSQQQQNQHQQQQHQQQHQNNGHQQSHHHQYPQQQHPGHEAASHHDANGFAREAAAAMSAYHQSYGAYGPTGYGANAAGATGPGAAGNQYAHHAAYATTAAGMAAAHYQADHHAASLKHDASLNSSHHQQHRELTASSGSSSAGSVKLELAGANGNPTGHYDTNSAATGAPDRQLHDDVRSPTGSTGSFMGDASMGSGDGTECEDEDNRGRRQQKKRGIFPKAATNIMRNWLFQHLNHPYPSEDQKKMLAEETRLTILQVNNWFINARRRIVQPMIDQSNRHGMNGAPGYSPDAANMSYMLGAAGAAAAADASGNFRAGLPGAPVDSLAASHAAAAMSSAMGAYSASAQHLSQYGRQQQQAMLGLATPPTNPHLMGAHPNLPPHEYPY